MKNPFELYTKHYVDKDDERLGLFLALSEKYKIKNVLYPGSFVHFTPSLVFPRVVYVDSYKKSADFFKDQSVDTYIKGHKLYSQEAQVVFHKADYYKDFGEKEATFDLLISQWAGFVSPACKRYLKTGGLLLANNSHGDASLASIDGDYKLVAVYNKVGNKYVLSEKELNEYLIPKSGIKITKEYLEKIQRGVGYTKTPSGYIFKRVN